MNDIDLMELVTKAHGNCKYFNDAWRCAETGYREFNPLEDDGHALRLAVKLDMQITINRVDGWTEAIGGYMGEHRMRLPHDSDMYAATRRAIVTVASKIGRNMP